MVVRVRTHIRTGQNAPGIPGVPALAFTTPVVYGGGTFSNNNDTFVSNTTPTCVVAAVSALNGKKCWTMRLDNFPGNYAPVGISLATGTAGSGIGFDGNNSWGFYTNNSTFGPSTTAGSPSVLSYGGNGSLVSICYDQATGKIWITTDGVNFSGGTNNIADVLGGTTCWIITPFVGAANTFPCVGSHTSAGHQWTFMSYQFTPPTGFTSL